MGNVLEMCGGGKEKEEKEKGNNAQSHKTPGKSLIGCVVTSSTPETPLRPVSSRKLFERSDKPQATGPDQEISV